MGRRIYRVHRGRLILLILLLANPVYGESLTIGLWTDHFNGEHTEGTDNHLIAYENTGYIAAWFRNSYGKETLFLGYGLHTPRLRNENMWIRGNIYGGALIGYGKEAPIHLGAMSPGVYPTLSIGYKEYSLEGGVMPTFWWFGFKVEW